jgi:predicted PurR-regulated permease PerM
MMAVFSDDISRNGAQAGHKELVGQPHTDAEGPVADAEVVAARISTAMYPLGRPGPPMNHRSPFVIGMAAAAGVAVTAGIVEMIITARQVLVLIGLALFLAIGLEPAVSFLARRWLPRWAAVTLILLTLLAVISGFLAAAIPPLVSQASAFITQAPHYLQNHHSLLGQLNDRFHLQQRLTHSLNESGSALTGGVLGAGAVVLGAVSSALVVVVLTVYFLADLPRIRRVLYRLVPHSRRPRTILIGDEIVAKIGGYVMGNVLVSLIAAVLTFGWLLTFKVPCPLLLAILVALLDLIPVLGSTIAGIMVCLAALTVSLPVALATGGFFVIYRGVEDYLLVPKIIGRVVKIPSLVTVVAILLGGALFGVIGALVAIPIAAAVLLVVREVLVPRLDQT